MSISSVGPSNPSTSAPSTGATALQSARAYYLRTGIDKDAAAGDPDHDAPRRVNPSAAPTAAPATQASSAGATVANAAVPQPTTSAAAAAAYVKTAKG